MRIDDPEGFFFLAEVACDLYQNEMFEYVGMVAGMEGVAVVEYEAGSKVR